MNNSLWTLGLSEFVDQTASANPTPGGGSVCTVSACLGLGLVVMALEITRKKPTSDEHAEKLDQLMGLGRELLNQLKERADADVRAFDGYLDALRMPKDNDEAKEVRAQAMQKAALTATKVPLAAGRAIHKALELAVEAAEHAKSQVVSDVAAGAELLGASILGVLHNIDVNLPALGEHEEAKGFRTERKELADNSAKLCARVRVRIRNRITG